jgi:hypothetical protein
VTDFRRYAAIGVMKQCARVGVTLLANARGVHAVPTKQLRKFPGLVAMVRRYRDEIMQELDRLVE